MRGVGANDRHERTHQALREDPRRRRPELQDPARRRHGFPRVLRALVESGAFLALLALFGLGIGAIIRHSAGSIAVFVGCTLLVPLVLHNVAGNASRFMPVMLGNSVGAVVSVSGSLSSTAAFGLMALHAAVALAVGAAFLDRRDA